MFLSSGSLNLCQVGCRGPSVDRHLQVSTGMFSWLQASALAGPLKDINRLVLKSLLHWFSCVLKIIVLVENKLSAQSEALNARDKVFLKVLSVFCLLSWHVPQFLLLKITSISDTERELTSGQVRESTLHHHSVNEPLRAHKRVTSIWHITVTNLWCSWKLHLQLSLWLA